MKFLLFSDSCCLWIESSNGDIVLFDETSIKGKYHFLRYLIFVN